MLLENFMTSNVIFARLAIFSEIIKLTIPATVDSQFITLIIHLCLQ